MVYGPFNRGVTKEECGSEAWRGMSDKPMLKGGQKQIKAQKEITPVRQTGKIGREGSRSSSLRGLINRPTDRKREMRNGERVLEQPAEEAGETADERKESLSALTMDVITSACFGRDIMPAGTNASSR